MNIQWTSKALSDLARLHEFLSVKNSHAAAQIVQKLTQAPSKILKDNPFLGVQLFEFEPHQVRFVVIDKYEIRYEVYNDTIYILRIWHTRENR